MADVQISSLVPLAQVKNVPESVAFYERLGFRLANSFTPPGEDEPSWASLMGGRGELMIGKREEDANGAPPVAFYVYCEDVRRKHAELAAAGIEVGDIATPFFNPGGEFRITDPDGYIVHVA
jgi:catechol 2,3-dioxygenase-like lactoylglutathione lyase family enzyme